MSDGPAVDITRAWPCAHSRFAEPCPWCLLTVAENEIATLREQLRLTMIDQANAEAEIATLRAALVGARDQLGQIARHRELCHEYDDDMEHEPRYFADDEEWERVERQAANALAAIDAALGGEGT